MGSRYNPRLSIIDNIQLPPTLLSRFDLIYLVLDKADEASDRKLARHLVAMYHATPPANAQVLATPVASGLPVVPMMWRSQLRSYHPICCVVPSIYHLRMCRAKAKRHLLAREHRDKTPFRLRASSMFTGWQLVCGSVVALRDATLSDAVAQAQATIPVDTLRDYIAYARSQCKPKLSEEAASTLIDGYVDMRRQGVSRKVSGSFPAA